MFSQTSYSQTTENINKKNNETLAPRHHIYKVIKGELAHEDSITYFHNLLRDALTLTIDEYGSFELSSVSFNYSQSRTLQLLNHPDILDITYSMTSVAREKEFIAIQIPLLNGLFGKRKLLVKAKDKEKFENISQSQLKALTACQNLHWPDFKILKKNGYKVYGVNEFDSNLKMLIKGRCDYFPRSTQEIDLEFKKFNGKYGQLEKINSVLLKYSAPVYFFVGKHDIELAQRLTKGLKELQESGELDNLLKKSENFHYDEFIEKTSSLKVFQLENN